MLSACIVTYNPKAEILSEIINILSKKSMYIILIDNNSSDKNFLNLFYNKTNTLVALNNNIGLGGAYNLCCKISQDVRAEWVMFVDQDSIPSESLNLTEIIEKLKYDSELYSKVAIVSINPDTATKLKQINNDFYLAKYVIGSGMIVKTEICNKHKFAEELFLYSIDIEYSTRLRRMGYLVLAYREQGIRYKIGERTEGYRKFWSKTVTTTLSKVIHKDLSRYPYYSNPMRYYIMLRNNIYLIVRRKIELSYSKYLPFFVLNMYERLGLKDTVKLTLRALKYGILGRLEEDNKKVFGGTGV